MYVCMCVHVCVWTGMITCVCVTLDWPSGKVGRQESQCESSQAFSPRLAGFITATNHWPDKSSYFILPSFTSASLSFSFSHSFISLKPPSTPPPSCLCGSFACFTLHPAWLALSFPSQCNSPIFYFLCFFPPSSLSFHPLPIPIQLSFFPSPP